MKNLILFFAVGVISSTTLWAQDGGEYDRFNDKWRFYGGGFFPQLTSSIAINGDIGTPPPINVEDELGLEDNKGAAFIGAQWQISNRNSVEFEYFQLKRDGSITLLDGSDEPIEIGDLIIQSGKINTAFDVNIGRLTYGYSIFRTERSNLKLKAGLHLADMSIGLELAGAICDLNDQNPPPVTCPTESTGAANEEVTAPLPHFGGSYAYAISPKWDLNVNLIGFAIELDTIDGELLEVDADIQWSPWEHFGIGAGLRYFRADVKSKGSDLNGEFEFKYWGPAIFVAASF
jgi:hypothetical protein